MRYLIAAAIAAWAAYAYAQADKPTQDRFIAVRDAQSGVFVIDQAWGTVRKCDGSNTVVACSKPANIR